MIETLCGELTHALIFQILFSQLRVSEDYNLKYNRRLRFLLDICALYYPVISHLLGVTKIIVRAVARAADS